MYDAAFAFCFVSFRCGVRLVGGGVVVVVGCGLLCCVSMDGWVLWTRLKQLCCCSNSCCRLLVELTYHRLSRQRKESSNYTKTSSVSHVSSSLRHPDGKHPAASSSLSGAYKTLWHRYELQGRLSWSCAAVSLLLIVI